MGPVCLVKSRGFAHLAALGLVSMMLYHVIVKAVVLVGRIGCSRQAALEKQDLCWKYLAHHELESNYYHYRCKA